MAKLKERWIGRSSDKLKALETRPDLTINKKIRARYRSRIIQEHEAKKEEMGQNAPTPDVQLSDIAKNVLNDPSFPAKVAASPGLLQVILKKMTEDSVGSDLIVQPIVYQVSQDIEKIGTYRIRPLGTQPSDLPVGEKVDAPTTPESDLEDNACFVHKNESEISGLNVSIEDNKDLCQ